MKLAWDEAKRRATLRERGLDFSDATELFDGFNFTIEDNRKDYGEIRYSSSGHIGERLCFVIWTQRGDARHIISLRKANEREQKRFKIQTRSGR